MQTELVAAASVIGKSLGKLHQTSHCNSGGALRDPRFSVLHPCGAGDIEMQPGCILRKFFEEHGGVDGAAPASARIHNVGNVRANVLLVLFVEWHAPHLLAS